ncbi:hypothetical protein [Deinococcus ruber]|uniref:YbhB/YbcL family Raf kinase inhibitor-like protein n=1 Tax=Deinococcus ruber TaxID=1848197 RepID=A0A918FFU5_9DEIO|nr:hypothetical protein [Deinococcus ruber]GGR35239.1 hypothetical protein GCM10008957_51520 [Deinococcus ruber]
MTPLKLGCVRLLSVAFLIVSAASALAAPFSVTLSAHDPALTCGSKVTPTLTFSAPPPGTKALAIIFWDEQPHTLTGRWTVYDLPLDTKALEPVLAGSSRILGAPVAVNEAGHLGYTAPCAAGKHDIYIDFYALNVASLGLAAGVPLQTVHAAIKRHKILEAKAHVVWNVK